MDNSNEITVKINTDFRSLVEHLLSQGFRLTEKFNLDDIYYIKKDTDLSLDVLEIIKDTVLIRKHTEKDFSKTYLTAKKKEFNSNGEILSQQKVDLEIISAEDAKTFLKMLGYKELMPIHAQIETYEKGDLGICIQWVNNDYLLVEVEEKGKLDTVDKLISALDSTQIDYDKSNYFVKKAQLIFEEKYR